MPCDGSDAEILVEERLKFFDDTLFQGGAVAPKLFGIRQVHHLATAAFFV